MSMATSGTLKIVVPDLVSNSYFPALAAVELGCFHDAGLDATVDLVFPVNDAYQALSRGEVDIVAGSAHSALAAFPDWKGVKLLCAQSQGMYWFLVMRADLEAPRNDVSVVRGRKIGAAPWVDLGLKQLLVDAGIDLSDVDIAPVPGAVGAGTNFGLTAALALAEGKIDGFWANGMAAATAVASETGTVVLDARRGDGPAGAFDYTFASVAATDDFIQADLPRAQAVVDAVRRAQNLLIEDPDRATTVGDRRFEPEAAARIAELVRRDTPFYSAGISAAAVDGLSRFGRERGLLHGSVPFTDIVATQIQRS